MNETNMNSGVTSVWSILTTPTKFAGRNRRAELAAKHAGLLAILVLVVTIDQQTVNSRKHTG